MADNLVQNDARKFEWAVAGKSSGDPVINGSMTGVCLIDTDSDGNVSVDTQGVYDLSVKAIDDDGNSAVAIGDRLYYVIGDTPLISKKRSGVFYGFALEAIVSGSTSTINVWLKGNVGIGTTDIPAEDVTLAKMADLARGSLISGQTANNRPTALVAETDGQILVGDGTDINSVAVSGDATLANDGTVTIATGAVEDSMIEALSDGEFIIGVDGTAANNAKVTMSGGATLANDGTLTVSSDYIKQTMLNRRFTFEEFETNPLTAKVGGGAAGGTAGDTNVLALEDNIFEYHVKGTQTITAPSLTSAGLNVGMDQTDNDGVEVSQGITSRSRGAFVVGTDAAFYAKCKFSIETVAGTDDCAFGFRKAEAYQANIDDYDEMACLNAISGNITIETILNGGETTATDTTDDWADAETHTLEIYVSAAGVVTYKIDGTAPTTTAAFTFDDGEVVVPFFFMLNANSSQAGVIALQEWEAGLQ